MSDELVSLIQKYDRAGPRYTSYPPATKFSDAYGPDDYRSDLADANRDAASPLSLYFHIPFCEARCAFCACNVIITSHHSAAESYLETLKREVDLIAGHLPDRRETAQLHLGGGTPTFLTPDELRELHSAVSRHFTIQPDAEVAIEVDPCVTTDEHMRALRDLGYNRLSMGVQDLTPEVQQAVRRNQTGQETERIFRMGRDLGFHSINIDLIYGLPLQTRETFAQTIDDVIEMRPDRVALYSFAHLPWLKRNQKILDSSQLPDPEVKLRLFVDAMERFLAAGYVKIGMDHFAVPEDELARALEDRRLYRNFMGYTVRPTNAMIGFGVSSIGELHGNMMQNTKKLNRYHNAIAEGRPPIERGYSLTFDDRVRRDVIQSIMCNFFVDLSVIEERYDIDSGEYFKIEQTDLAELETNDFIGREGKKIIVKQRGQLFIRNVAMVFDIYLRQRQSDKPQFSRTV